MELREILILVVSGLMMIWTLGFVAVYVCNMIKKHWPTTFSWDLFRCHLFPELTLNNDRAKAQMEEKRQRRMRTVVLATLGISFSCAAAAVINILGGKERIWTVGLDVAFVITYLITIAFSVRTSLLTPVMCRLYYSLWMTFVMLQVSPAVRRSPADLVVAEILFGHRIFMSWAIMDPCIVMPWNALYSVLSCWQYAFTSQEQTLCWNYGTGFFACKELMCFCVVSAIGYSCAVGAAAEIQEKIGAAASRNECGAVTSLLRAMSDVVVKLDATRHVMEDAPKLAALLLRGSGGESMRGALFERFLYSEEDKVVFRDHLHGEEGNIPEIALPVRLRLRDGDSTGVTVDLYHTRIEDVVDHTIHMIGIREVQPHLDSQGSVGRSTEWGADLAPMNQHQMDASAFLEVLAQSEYGSLSPPSEIISDTGLRKSKHDIDVAASSYTGSQQRPNPTVLGNSRVPETIPLAVTQTPSREVQL